MNLIQILLPVEGKNGEPLPRRTFDDVQAELTERFGGVTAFVNAPAHGIWRKAGSEEHDRVILFEVMTDELDVSWWSEFRERLERAFLQEEVVVRAMPITRL